MYVTDPHLTINEMLKKHSAKVQEEIEEKLDQIQDIFFQFANGYQLIIDLGHNDDCIFCGLKDKYAKKAVDDFYAARTYKGNSR